MEYISSIGREKRHLRNLKRKINFILRPMIVLHQWMAFGYGTLPMWQIRLSWRWKLWRSRSKFRVTQKLEKCFRLICLSEHHVKNSKLLCIGEFQACLNKILEKRNYFCSISGYVIMCALFGSSQKIK